MQIQYLSHVNIRTLKLLVYTKSFFPTYAPFSSLIPQEDKKMLQKLLKTANLKKKIEPPAKIFRKKTMKNIKKKCDNRNPTNVPRHVVCVSLVTGWPVKHGCVFLVHCKMWLVQCTGKSYLSSVLEKVTCPVYWKKWLVQCSGNLVTVQCTGKSALFIVLERVTCPVYSSVQGTFYEVPEKQGHV